MVFKSNFHQLWVFCQGVGLPDSSSSILALEPLGFILRAEGIEDVSIGEKWALKTYFGCSLENGRGQLDAERTPRILLRNCSNGCWCTI